MLLRCLRAELVKFRRSPVWLAFVVLPLFPAFLGTFNYLGNLSVLSDAWYSLWSQHTLFSSMFFLPALLGVFCAWQWRLEHADHNWNSFLTAPVPVGDLCLAKLIWAAVISLLSQAWIEVYHQRQAGGSYRSHPAGTAGVASVRGPGRRVGVRGTALFQPHHPGFCSAGGLWAGGRYRWADGHGPGVRVRLPVFSALHRDAGQ